MIASTSSGSSFSALGSYLEGGRGGEPDGVPSPDRVAWVEAQGVVRDVDGSVPVGRAARVMEATAALNPRCTEPCYHLSISFDPGGPYRRGDLPGGPSDPEARRVMLGVAGRTLRDLGLDEHQVVVVAHGDREHPHMHLMVNRVHPETGRAWDRWQDRVRIERSLRVQERELGLREVPGQLGRLDGQERPARGLPAGAYRAAEREAKVTGERPALGEARERVGPAFQYADSWDGLEGKLAEHGYVLRAKGRGLVVRDERGREVKASAVSRDGGRGRLEERFGETWREHRGRVEARTGEVPPGLSPHGEAALRAHRDAEGARRLEEAVAEAGRRVGAARRSVYGHAAWAETVEGRAGEFRRALGTVYEDPAGAEGVFLKLVRAEGDGRAVEELARRPERFGQLRREEHRTLGVVTRRTEDAARAAAPGAARAGERYLGEWRALAAARERDPQALREAERSEGRARAGLEGRPGSAAVGRRLEGLGRGVTGADKRVLGRAAPGVVQAVEKAVTRGLAREAERGLGFER